MKNNLVTIIILNWNGLSVTKDCIQSLLNISYDNYKIILTDNGSKDGSQKSFSELFSQNTAIDLLFLESNTGFTGGNNAAIEYAKQKYDPAYFLLLNNDTVVESNFLDEMVTVLKNDDNCYAVVPKIFYYDIPGKIWFAGGKISRLTGVVKHFGENEIDSGKYNLQTRTGFMNGCCALLPKKAIAEIGLLDNRFFANSEDADYSLRILKAGHNIAYAPSAIVYHKVSYSFKSNKGKWFAFYLAARGIVLLQKKHLSGPAFAVFLPAFFIRWLFYLTLKLSFLGDFKSIKGIYKGASDGLKGRLRMN